MRKRFFDVNLLVLIFAIALILSSADRNCAAIENGTSETGTLYFFTNEGCRPCKQVEPILRGLADRGFPVTKVDTSVYPQWVNRFRISTTPTVVLVKGNREIKRHSGFIDSATVEQWFQSVGISPSSNHSSSLAGQPNSTSPSQDAFIEDINKKRTLDAFDGDTSTLLEGTRTPGNPIEQLAMNATVKIRVEDPEGISYATGTIIHCREGQWLVMTCGHVFRDSGGTGTVSVEYDFENDSPRTAPGQLVKYDAGSRDIGLIAVSAGVNIAPVPLADRGAEIKRSTSVFSIGCDHGDPPTIRRTKIKRTAAYFDDKITKYDIYGRPVDGRSGGGLFTTDGKLIGVCNAAAVDFDEGIYTALETVYWQIATANLSQLFEPEAQTALVKISPRSTLNNKDRVGSSGIAANLPEGTRFPQTPPFEKAQPPARRTDEGYVDNSPRRNVALLGRDGNIPSSASTPNDMEVILIVRSKADPTRTEAITLTDPSPQLLKYLEKIGNQQTGETRVDMAQLRHQLSREPVVSR